MREEQPGRGCFDLRPIKQMEPLLPCTEERFQSNTARNDSGLLHTYDIGAGDILEVSVWREPDLQRRVVVRIDGRISLPLIGDIQAAGMSINDLNKFITAKFARFVSGPMVGTILVESRSKRYYMIGKITNPGEYAIESPITVLQALARAGGFAEWAKTSRIIIVRRQNPKEITLEFDYEAVVKGADLEQNILINPGDTIIVP